MNTLVLIAIIIVFVFVLTYDPKSRKLDKYITPVASTREQPLAPQQVPSACASDRYHDLQFNSEAKTSGCTGKSREFMGAVI